MTETCRFCKKKIKDTDDVEDCVIVKMDDGDDFAHRRCVPPGVGVEKDTVSDEEEGALVQYADIEHAATEIISQAKRKL
jgi:hypothetical protein